MSPIFSHNFSIPVHCCPSDCGLLLTLLRDIRAVSADHQGRDPLILIPWPTEKNSEVLRQSFRDRDYHQLPQLPSGNSFHPVQTRV